MSDEDVPEKKTENWQVDAEIDQRNVDHEPNADPDKLRLDTANIFIQATEQTRMALCISDPQQDDCPIVYVNEAFVRLTGYSREDVLGKNCRFLQGNDTDPNAVQKIRDALDSAEVEVVDILNYRKDGTPFWNALHIGPMLDEDGKVEYFYGSQWDVTKIFTTREQVAQQKRISKELQHRTNNLFAILSALVSLTSRGATDAQELSSKLMERIQALGKAHSASIRSGEGIEGSADLRELIRTILEPYTEGEHDRIVLRGKPIELPRQAVTPVGLTLHELATNAVKYGAFSCSDGRVEIDWTLEDDNLQLHWNEYCPEGVLADQTDNNSAGTGTRIMTGVLGGIGGAFASEFEDHGLSATVDIPIVEIEIEEKRESEAD